MPKTNQNGQVRVYKRDNYEYYLAIITLLRKTYRKRELAEDWLKLKRSQQIYT